MNALGNQAVVGAPARNGAEGAAYVFVRHGGTWVQQGELQPSDGTPADNDYFGWSVSVNALGDEAIVGAWQGNGGEGTAYVYVDRGGQWPSSRSCKPPTRSPATASVSRSRCGLGDEAVVDAYAQDNTEGAAYVFGRHAGEWAQKQKLQAADAAAGDIFGYSVALDALGDTRIVGAPDHAGAGAAYVFAGL